MRLVSARAGTSPLLDFVYYESHGTVLMRSPWLAAAPAHEAMLQLGRSALGGAEPALEPGFALQRLKEPFRPLSDGDDLVSVCVKALLTACTNTPSGS